MRRALFILFISTFFLVPLVSQTPDLENILNPEVTLEKLNSLGPGELDDLIESDKYIIIDGTIASITEIERSDNNLILDIHLVSGRWKGLESVVDYKCIVNVTGKEWEERFPKRTPRTITDELLLQNYHVMVIGKVSSYVMDNSELTAVVDAHRIRRIQ